jgi:hypothetical protein
MRDLQDPIELVFPGFTALHPGLFSDVPYGNLRPRVNLLMDGTNFQGSRGIEGVPLETLKMQLRILPLRSAQRQDDKP